MITARLIAFFNASSGLSPSFSVTGINLDSVVHQNDPTRTSLVLLSDKIPNDIYLEIKSSIILLLFINLYKYYSK